MVVVTLSRAESIGEESAGVPLYHQEQIAPTLTSDASTSTLHWRSGSGTDQTGAQLNVTLTMEIIVVEINLEQ